MTRAARLIGPAIAGGAALLVATVAAFALVGRDRVVRPDQRSLPLPQGAVVRYAEERCAPARGRTVCDVVLAVGPADGLQLPAPAETLLTGHLVERGWRPRGDVLVAPGRPLQARVTGFEQVGDQLSEDIAGDVRDHVTPDELAVVVLEVPGSSPAPAAVAPAP